jgi:hypothetical protein
MTDGAHALPRSSRKTSCWFKAPVMRPLAIRCPSRRRAQFLDPRKFDLLPAIQQRSRVALQRSRYLEPVEVRK